MDLHFDCKSKYSRTPFGQISSCLMAWGRCRCSVRGVISVCLLRAPRDTLRLGHCHSSSELGPVAAPCFPCFEGTAATVARERGWPPRGRRGPLCLTWNVAPGGAAVSAPAHRCPPRIVRVLRDCGQTETGSMKV